MGRKLSDFEPLWPAEHLVTLTMGEGQIIRISDGVPPEDAPREFRLRASFVRYLALGGCEAFRPPEIGVAIWGAFIEGDGPGETGQTAGVDLDRCNIVGDLALFCCRIPDCVTLRGANGGLISFNRSILHGGINGDRVVAHGLSLRFVCSEASIRVVSARLHGNLDCSSSILRISPGCSPDEAQSLNISLLISGGSVFLRDAEVCGEVRAINTKIDGNFDFQGALMRADTDEDGVLTPALDARKLVVGGDVLLNHTVLLGTGVLSGSAIGGDLDCSDSRFFAETDESGEKLDWIVLEGAAKAAIDAKRVEVKGSLLLPRAVAHGAVRFVGAKIGADVDLAAGMFHAMPDRDGGSRMAVNLERIRAGAGTLFLRDAAEIDGVLNLSGSNFRAIDDTEDSWPTAGNFLLDQCKYGAFSGPSPKHALSRLRWIGLQKPTRWGVDFWPQPYEQLAKVLREMGHSADARTVLVEKERLQRAARRETWQARLDGARLRLRVEREGIAVVELEIVASLDRFQPTDPRRGFILEELRKSPEVRRRLDQRDAVPERVAQDEGATDRIDRVSGARAPIWDYWWRLNLLRVWDGVVGATIGYGRRPERAALWAVGFLLMGWFIFASAGGHGAIKPNTPVVLRSDEWVSCADAVGQTQVQCFLEQPRAASYPQFNAFVYSADTLLPIVDLEMQGFWIPDDRTWGGAWARGYLWVHIAVGWALSLLAVAGFSGLVKSD